MRARLLTFLLLTGLAAQAATRTNISNAVVAIVEGAVITSKDLDNEMRQIVEVYRAQYGHDPAMLQQKMQAAEKEVTEQLIDRQLILHEFNKQGYKLPESFIEDDIKRDIRDTFGDRLKLTKTLQAEGERYENYRQRTRDRLIVQSLSYKNISSEVFISPQKIEEYYNQNRDKYKLEDQVKLRMIVINQRPDRDLEAARKLAREIKAKVKEGAAFSQMATIYSDGSQRTQGGDWGWVERSVLTKPLAEAAFALKTGEVSDLIELGGSVYLMVVEESKLSHVRPVGDVRDEIEKVLLQMERERLRKKWIEKLRSKFFVRYF